jgi:hypothetical protein
MLVTRVLGDCPGCGAKNSFGNVSVHDHVLRGCKHCRYQSMVWLPEIRKRVIYLDQFFFSGAMRGNDPRFKEAAERVKRMCHLQLLVAPFSSVHEDEAHQWRGHDGMTGPQLMDFIKATSRGAEFEKAYNVEHSQVYKAWEAFLKGKPPKYPVENKHAISGGTLDKWDNYFRIDVGGYTRDIELNRRLKSESVDELVRVLDKWQASDETFDEAVALEIRDASKQYVGTYLTMLNQYAQGDFAAAMNPPMVATVVEQMMHWLPNDQPLPERIGRCIEFFQSPHFSEVPHEWLSSHMFATMKAMVKRGTFANREEARKRLSGVFEDIRHISIYAPYCDAIVIDKFMADLVCRPTVGIEQRYGLRVFSLSNWDTLLTWLDRLETEMSEDHRRGVAAAYPL